MLAGILIPISTVRITIGPPTVRVLTRQDSQEPKGIGLVVEVYGNLSRALVYKVLNDTAYFCFRNVPQLAFHFRLLHMMPSAWTHLLRASAFASEKYKSVGSAMLSGVRHFALTRSGAMVGFAFT